MLSCYSMVATGLCVENLVFIMCVYYYYEAPNLIQLLGFCLLLPTHRIKKVERQKRNKETAAPTWFMDTNDDDDYCPGDLWSGEGLL